MNIADDARLSAVQRHSATDPAYVRPAQGQGHAVSWAAVFAGATAAAALSLILLILGTGLGLSSVSPWVHDGVSATSFGASTIGWITFTQLAAAGLGGYLAGRLRARWADAQHDEIYFRDTAHGFLAWATATLATAALLTSAIGTVLDTGAKAGASVVAGGTAAAATAATAAAAPTTTRSADMQDGAAYFVDSLFRPDAATPPSATSTPAAQTGAGAAAQNGDSASAGSAAEAARIFANGLKNGSLPADDASYLGRIVALRTGLNQQDAQKRVTDTFARMQAKARDAEVAAREAADKARKASAYAALWLFVSLLAGAFIASLAATFGGRQRDQIA
jgi:hypothetical protein